MVMSSPTKVPSAVVTPSERRWISSAPGLLILYWFFGQRIVARGLVAAAMIPLLLGVTVIGLRLGTWMGRRRLRNVSLALLLLIGAVGLAAPWM